MKVFNNVEGVCGSSNNVETAFSLGEWYITVSTGITVTTRLLDRKYVSLLCQGKPIIPLGITREVFLLNKVKHFFFIWEVSDDSCFQNTNLPKPYPTRMNWLIFHFIQCQHFRIENLSLLSFQTLIKSEKPWLQVWKQMRSPLHILYQVVQKQKSTF